MSGTGSAAVTCGCGLDFGVCGLGFGDGGLDLEGRGLGLDTCGFVNKAAFQRRCIRSHFSCFTEKHRPYFGQRSQRILDQVPPISSDICTIS